jgi:hypothetical protein
VDAREHSGMLSGGKETFAGWTPKMSRITALWLIAGLPQESRLGHDRYFAANVNWSACMVRPCVARVFDALDLGSCMHVSGLVLERLLRAIMDISAHSISLADRPHRAKRTTSIRVHREDRSPLRVSLSQTSAGVSVPISSVPHTLFLVRPQPFPRPDLRFPTGAAHRAGQGWPSLRLCRDRRLVQATP